MKKAIIAVAFATALAGCTTAERDVAVGAGVGAVAGQVIGGSTSATLIGAGAGALAGYIITRNRRGECQFRDRRTGRTYIDTCPRGY